MKTKEELQAELNSIKAKLDAAEKASQAKPTDANLKGKVTGLKNQLAKKEEELANFAEPPAPDQSDSDTSKTEALPEGSKDGASKKIKIKAHHLGQNPSYFRCGLRFTKIEQEYSIFAKDLAILMADKNLKVEK
ncbi:MAG: hypothetical protein ACRC5H_09695 [Treponemataceae bacterium]